MILFVLKYLASNSPTTNLNDLLSKMDKGFYKFHVITKATFP